MGRAIADYYKNGEAGRLSVFSPMFEEDEIPLATLFRTYDAMPGIEQKALDLTKGRTLDVGAASGCHSLVLQERGIDVTAIDISSLSVETMLARGVKKVILQDFFRLQGQQYDTILMLMNGIGIVGTLDRMPELSYVFEDEDGFLEYPVDMGYYGELSFRMQYKETIGEPFPWLYVDSDTLRKEAEENGYGSEVVAEGEHFDYLARITKK